MKFIGTTQPLVALFEYDENSLADRFPIARATLTEENPKAHILEVYDLQEEDGRYLVGILYINLEKGNIRKA